MPDRNIKRADNTEQHRKNHDVPDLNSIQQRQGREGKGQKHRRRLYGKHGAAPRIHIGDRASDRCKDEDGKLRGKTDDAEQRRRSGQTIDQPRLRNRLHPSADKGRELSHEKKAVISVAQRA